MTPNNIAQDAIAILNKKITDEIFLIIQNDRDLMQRYLQAVAAGNGHDAVNQQIGKEVKRAYGLKSADREGSPSSTLIQSHQKFD